jgi:hypothetical protein
VPHAQTRAPRAPKTARPNLVRLHVSGDICPNLLPRLLGLVAQFDEIPYGIALAIGALMIYPETDWIKAIDLTHLAMR